MVDIDPFIDWTADADVPDAVQLRKVSGTQALAKAGAMQKSQVCCFLVKLLTTMTAYILLPKLEEMAQCVMSDDVAKAKQVKWRRQQPISHTKEGGTDVHRQLRLECGWPHTKDGHGHSNLNA
jgi:hypothetical protein